MHSEEAVMISDNWHTDIIMSLQSGLETVLMFSSYLARQHRAILLRPDSPRRVGRRDRAVGAALAEPLPGAKRTMLRDQRQHLASDSTPSPIIVTVVWGRR